jgi:hypothetical protein
MTEPDAMVSTDALRAAHLFVSTSLDTWATNRPEMFARDFQINDVCYRRLDPEYFAWLRAKMTAAQKAAQSGQVPIDAFNALRSRFNAIQSWAVAHFGESSLREAVGVLNARVYALPVLEPSITGALAPGSSGQDVRERRTPHEVSPDATVIVDKIREKALALGWNRDRLYRVPENCHSGLSVSSGLLCYLREGWRIGEVTRQSIETIGPPPLEVRQRFYNPDVDQPWVIRLDRK